MPKPYGSLEQAGSAVVEEDFPNGMQGAQNNVILHHASSSEGQRTGMMETAWIRVYDSETVTRMWQGLST